MKRAVCKPRIGAEDARRLPKRRDETYDVRVKDSAHGLFKYCKDNSRTTWLISKDVKIGVQNKHIEELGINLLNYLKPVFAKGCPKPSRTLEICSSGPKSPDLENVDQLLKLKQHFAGQVRREPLQMLKMNSRVFNSYKLQKLLCNEHVQMISSRELKDRLKKGSALRTNLLPNRVVKQKRRLPNAKRLTKSKLHWRKKKNVTASERNVPQKLNSVKLAGLDTALQPGDKISFELFALNPFAASLSRTQLALCIFPLGVVVYFVLHKLFSPCG